MHVMDVLSRVAFGFASTLLMVMATQAEREKGQTWGLKTVESFHTYGTPQVGPAKTGRS